MQTVDFLIALICFFGWEKATHIVEDNSVGKIVNDGLDPKTLVRALPYATVWIDEPSPFVGRNYELQSN